MGIGGTAKWGLDHLTVPNPQREIGPMKASNDATPSAYATERMKQKALRLADEAARETDCLKRSELERDALQAWQRYRRALRDRREANIRALKANPRKLRLLDGSGDGA